MFKWELTAEEVLYLGKILMEAASKHDVDEAVDLFHQLVKLIEEGRS